MRTVQKTTDRGEDMLPDLGKLIRGGKTSEFYVVLLVLLPWICQQFGVNYENVIQNADELRNAIEAAHGGSSMPVWVAMAYVVGRKLLKWQAGR